MIDALISLFNNILIVCILEFLLSSAVPASIWEFIGFLPPGFGGKITPKVICNKSVALNSCLLFEINFF